MGHAELTPPGSDAALLDVNELSLEIEAAEGRRTLLRRLSLRIDAGQIVGLVGESGSGKTLTGLSVLGLPPRLPSPRYEGAIHFDGIDLVRASESDRARLRGRSIAYVPQEPMSALNPVLRISRQLGGVLRHHHGIDRAAAAKRGKALLAELAIDDVERVWNAYPFELSGGLRQRVLIAMAFSGEPRLIVADEPTTALDVTVQKQVLALLLARAHESRTAVLLVSHDLALIANTCAKVFVMYGGCIVESGPTGAVLKDPQHPYTRALLGCRPVDRRQPTPLTAIPPGPVAAPPACPFQPRCSAATSTCAQEPPWRATRGDAVPSDDAAHGADPAAVRHTVACWHAGQA